MFPIPFIVINRYPEEISRILHHLEPGHTTSINVGCSTAKNKADILLWAKSAGCQAALSDDECKITFRRPTSGPRGQWVMLYACSKCKTISPTPVSQCPGCHSPMEVI